MKALKIKLKNGELNKQEQIILNDLNEKIENDNFEAESQDFNENKDSTKAKNKDVQERKKNQENESGNQHNPNINLDDFKDPIHPTINPENLSTKIKQKDNNFNSETEQLKDVKDVKNPKLSSNTNKKENEEIKS